MRLLLALFMISLFSKPSIEDETLQRNNTNIRAQINQYAQNIGLKPPESIILNHSPEEGLKNLIRRFEVRATNGEPDGWRIEMDPDFLLKSSDAKRQFHAAYLVCDQKTISSLDTYLHPLAITLRCVCEQVGMRTYTQFLFEEQAVKEPKVRKTMDEIVNNVRRQWGDIPYQ